MEIEVVVVEAIEVVVPVNGVAEVAVVKVVLRLEEEDVVGETREVVEDQKVVIAVVAVDVVVHKQLT